MSDINRFLAKKKEFTINGEKLEISPIKMEDYDLISRASSADESIRSDAMKELLIKTIKSAFPEATDDTVKMISIEFIPDFIEAMLEVNNLSVPEGEEKKVLEAFQKGKTK